MSSTESTHVSDVFHSHGRAVVVGDDQRAVIDGVKELIVVVDGPRIGRVGEMALGLVRVRIGKGRLRTVSRPMPYLLSAVGFSSTRTPGSELPPTVTCPTPSTCENLLREDGRCCVVHLALACRSARSAQ